MAALNLIRVKGNLSFHPFSLKFVKRSIAGGKVLRLQKSINNRSFNERKTDLREQGLMRKRVFFDTS